MKGDNNIRLIDIINLFIVLDVDEQEPCLEAFEHRRRWHHHKNRNPAVNLVIIPGIPMENK